MQINIFTELTFTALKEQGEPGKMAKWRDHCTLLAASIQVPKGS